MTTTNQQLVAKSERTLLTSMLVSAPGPILTGIAALSGGSATQIADFIRRSAELVALALSWWVFRKLQRSGIGDDQHRSRLERIADRAVRTAMVCSGIAMLLIGIRTVFVYETGGNVSMGLLIAVMGVLANTWFWWRYRGFTRARPDVVLAGQQKLYRAKAWVDLCVVVALTAVTIAPAHPATHFVDALGSIIVAGYLLYSGLSKA